jgi:hypothetical protein
MGGKKKQAMLTAKGLKCGGSFANPIGISACMQKKARW